MKRIFFLWLKYTLNSFSSAVYSRFGAGLFLFAKILRFLLFFVFLFILQKNTKALIDYSVNQIIFFYLVFNLIDTLTQLLFREVYRFRQKVVRGDFDLDLVQPVNPLFKALAGGADLLDLFLLLPNIFLLFLFGLKLTFTPISLFLFLLLFLNGFLIATSFHIIVLSLGVLTTEVDHAIMIYRDLTNVGRVPIDIYQEPIRSFFTFIIPVGIMVTFPPKALFNLLSTPLILISLVFGAVFFFLSLFLWRHSLTQYSSASS